MRKVKSFLAFGHDPRTEVRRNASARLRYQGRRDACEVQKVVEACECEA